MTTTAELLKKLIGKNIEITFLPGGHYIKEHKKRGGYIITDIGEQFIEAKSTSSSNTKKYYFNINSTIEIILLG